MVDKKKESSRSFFVGLLVSFGLLVGMTFLFFIGSEQKLFSRKNEYHVMLESVSGLAQGNPVQLAGVTIGVVKDIRLPRKPENRRVEITIMIERKYAERIRKDSRARLKKLGLIAADSYIDVSPGSPQLPQLEPGSVIPAAKQTNVDALITSGEDLVDNFVQISYSLKNILSRVDRGEGLIGELTSQPQTKQRLTDTFLATLNRTNQILDRVQEGRGVVGRLVFDNEYAQQLLGSVNSSVSSIQTVMTSLQRSFESGEGALPALLNDPAGREKVIALVENLRLSSENLALFSDGLRKGEGLVPRLLNDREYADQTLAEFNMLVARLNDTARKLNEGEGTAGKLISDPSLYESINDILIGINESKLLRWLVRDRQQKGIETRYDAATEREEKPSVPPGLKSKITPPREQAPPPVPETKGNDGDRAMPPDTTTTAVPPAGATPPPAAEGMIPPPL